MRGEAVPQSVRGDAFADLGQGRGHIAGAVHLAWRCGIDRVLARKQPEFLFVLSASPT
jgi:hypothetical protein